MHRYSYEESPKYVIRFDDLCPEMNHEVWSQIEVILYRYGVKPIIAVIPDNHDQHLIRGLADPKFWMRIKKYQDDGFMVAIHGYDHVYVNHKSGLLGISANSEFAGLPFEEQLNKIQAGRKIFEHHNIHPDAFIAPSHSFDQNTLKAINGITRIISDGSLERTFSYKNFLWIPCQMWDVIKNRECGLFTVCMHHNSWRNEDIARFEEDILKFRGMIISPFDVVQSAEPLKKVEIASIALNSLGRKVKRIVKNIVKQK